LYLLGNKRKQNRLILLQQILSYFLVPLLIAGPLALALSTALLGYFENFANTSISIDIHRSCGLPSIQLLPYLVQSRFLRHLDLLKIKSKLFVGLTEDHTTYVANFKENIDKREVETFLSQWIEKYYFTRDGAELNPRRYKI